MSSTSPSSQALIALPVVHSSSSPSSHDVASESTSSATMIEYQEQEEQWQPILHASNQVVLYNPRSHALSITSASAGPAVVVTRPGRDHDAEVGGRWCPYCKQRLPAGFEIYEIGGSMRMNSDDEHVRGGRGESQGDRDSSRWGEARWDHGHGGTFDDDNDDGDNEFEALSTDPAYHSRASDYFRLLAIANERSTGISSTSTPHGAYRVGTGSSNDEPSDSSVLGEGTSHGRNTATIPEDAFPADKMAEGYFKTFFQEEYKLGMGANGSVFLCQVHFIYIYI